VARGKRGVSQVVGAVVLLLVGLTLMAMIVAVWDGDLDGSYSTVSTWVTGQQASIPEVLKVEEPHFVSNSSGKFVDTTVYNIGGVSSIVSNVFVNGTLQWSGAYLVTLSGQTAQRTMSFSYPWISGRVYIITVVTKGGSPFSSSWSAP
jgi:archaellum component FlaF (FlaF/FlaG flagellin family)